MMASRQYRNLERFVRGADPSEYEETKIHNLIQRVLEVLALSGKSFDILQLPKQGVGEIYKIQKAMGLLPQLIEKPKKSDEEAKRLRDKGNQAYRAQRVYEALRLYTEAIRCAELDGAEILLAFANRSAVTFELQEYQNSIQDLDRALSSDKYPKNLIPKLLERRGKCYLALFQFRVASEDFKQLIQLMLTDIDIDKVNRAKVYLNLLSECLGKEDIPMTSNEQPPAVSHGPSQLMKGASAAVDIKYSLEMGKHVVASKDIAPGDILAVEKPYASIIYLDRLDCYCNNCLERCHSSIPCPSCNNVVFCSEACREASWTTHHSLECGVLHILRDLDCSGNLLLTFRILLISTELGQNLKTLLDDFSDDQRKPEKLGFVSDEYLSDHHKGVHHLLDHWDQCTPDGRLHNAVEACVLVHILKEKTTFFGFTQRQTPASDFQSNHIVAACLLIRLRHIVATNSYGIGETTLMAENGREPMTRSKFGGGVYPFCSLFNHSCVPNVFMTNYKGDTAVMIATKPIMKGDQIFTSYCLHYANTDLLTRQKVLSSAFHFKCKCPACTEDWPLTIDLPQCPNFISQSAKKAYERRVAESCSYLAPILTAGVTGNLTEEHLRFLKKHLILTSKCVKLPWALQCLAEEALIRYFQFSFSPYKLKNSK